MLSGISFSDWVLVESSDLLQKLYPHATLTYGSVKSK